MRVGSLGYMIDSAPVGLEGFVAGLVDQRFLRVCAPTLPQLVDKTSLLYL